MWQHFDDLVRVFWLRYHQGHVVTLTCEDDTIHLLVLSVYQQRGVWWLSGYDRGDIGEPLLLPMGDIREVVVAN